MLMFLLSFGNLIIGQEIKKKEGGDFTLGLRSTTSFFDNTNNGKPGIGTGGDFRIKLSKRVNTDWFADYILSTTDFLNRNDFHIGWSVLYYPFKTEDHGFKPYVLAGHCFDYSQLVELNNFKNKADRWSSAIQGGIGTHYFFTERFDMIFQAQYMMHLGTHLEAEIHDSEVDFHTDKGTLEEGHLLITIGFNYKIGKLWGR
jgi:hypothetical protein